MFIIQMTLNCFSDKLENANEMQYKQYTSVQSHIWLDGYVITS
jgi:hypothetical protein